MQKFYDTTLVSKFIKYLLLSTPLPIYSYIEDGGIMVENNYYIYHGRLYKCTRTGVFMGSHKYPEGHLCCSEVVYCSNDLRITDSYKCVYSGKRLARYDIVDLYKEGSTVPGVTEDFMSTRGFYDPTTHKKLGDYLRLLKSMYDLDLMSLYNCYCDLYVTNIDLSKNKLREAENPDYKTTLVPVKFNKTYTIAMNVDSPVYIKPVLYDGKLIRNNKGKFVYNNKYTSIKKMSHMSFSQPFNLTIQNTDSEAQSLERHLYLAIQMPVTLATPIVVLEGEFKNHNSTQIFDNKLFQYTIEPYINGILVSKCSLLDLSWKDIKLDSSPTFSDRLVEYLIGHTIDCREPLSENIERVTDSFEHQVGHSGSWSTELRGKLFTKYMELHDKKDEFCYADILGYVDKDIEDALNKGVLKYGRKWKV